MRELGGMERNSGFGRDDDQSKSCSSRLIERTAVKAVSLS